MARGYERQDGPVHDLHTQIPVPMKDQIWAAAQAADLSPSQWLRRAIRDQLAREAGK
jgi:hypothetical protein